MVIFLEITGCFVIHKANYFISTYIDMHLDKAAHNDKHARPISHPKSHPKLVDSRLNRLDGHPKMVYTDSATPLCHYQ